MTAPSLPAGFRLGTATTAYHVEGAATTDGSGPSVWDTFSHRPGAILDGSTPDVAAGHYHRLAEDLGLMSALGVRSHLFSLSWSRVLPEGRGRVNSAGLDFYDRLVDGLLGVGIEPTAVLCAGDLPQVLEADGGWLNRASVEAFGDYAAIVGARLADRVAHWAPLQAPNTVAIFGYALGDWAPGRRLGLAGLAAAHHLLLAHGHGVAALRSAGARSVGCATNHAPVWPASEEPADVGAAKLIEAVWNGFFLESMLLGHYPALLEPLTEGLVEPGDLATIRQALDFYGVDYASPLRIAAAREGADLPVRGAPIMGYPLTDAGWPDVPDALGNWLVTTAHRYGAALPPLVVTGCGAAYDVAPDDQGRIDDQRRIDYLSGHLAAVAAAARDGVDVRGFHVSSLLDGWDQTLGHLTRTGLVHVDRDTLARTPKASFRWYADLVAAQAATA